MMGVGDEVFRVDTGRNSILVCGIKRVDESEACGRREGGLYIWLYEDR